jgi:AAA15 family ATPase/GTPase
MLKEISVKNFKSFCQEQTFSMEADASTVGEHPEHIIEVNGSSILKVTSIYGPNGGGKSNLFKAIELGRELVIPSEPQMLTQFGFNNSSPFDSCRFSNDKTISESMFFINESFEIGYFFDVRMEKNVQATNSLISMLRSNDYLSPSIVEEKITFRKVGEKEFKTLLVRKEDGHIESEYFSAQNIINPSYTLNPSMSVVFNIYKAFVNNKSIDLLELQVINSLWRELCSIVKIDSFSAIASSALYGPFIENSKAFLLSSLNSLDIKVNDIIVKKTIKGFYDVYFERVLGGKKFYIDIDDESDGTKKAFNLLVTISSAKYTPFIFISDDLDAYLHPKLISAIVKFMSSDANTSSQLIFNSHDIINMTNELFRRDEIWFAYRDENYSTVLTPLSSIENYEGKQVRKDAKYSKQYLEGRYGADPFIKKGLSWND